MDKINSSMIDPISCIPIFLKPYIKIPNCESVDCGCATGFVVKQNGIFFLVTNYHVLSGRRSTDNDIISKHGGTPTHLKCYFHSSKLGEWEEKDFPLVDENRKPFWITCNNHQSEHFQFKDVAILQISEIENIVYYPIDICKNESLRTSPCSLATVLGFPAGKKSYRYFPIWVTGFIGSEPELDYNDLPILLINATTTMGMSGSPVFQIAEGIHTDSSGDLHVEPGRKSKFLGVYSGRITGNQLGQETVFKWQNNQNNTLLHIGIVWKPSIINNLIQGFLK